MAHAHQVPARTTPSRSSRLTGTLINLAVGFLGLLTIALGIWSFTDPHAFATWVQFPVHVHFLHDIGAFQIGLGVTLLLALLWRDGLAVALGGFFAGNTLHVLSHVIDRDLGGRPTDWLLLGILSVIALAALLARLRQLAEHPPQSG